MSFDVRPGLRASVTAGEHSGCHALVLQVLDDQALVEVEIASGGTIRLWASAAELGPLDLESDDLTQAKIDAIRSGTTTQPPEVDAIGLVFQEVLRPVVIEPLPWGVIDALRAVDKSERRRRSTP